MDTCSGGLFGGILGPMGWETMWTPAQVVSLAEYEVHWLRRPCGHLFRWSLWRNMRSTGLGDHVDTCSGSLFGGI